MLALTGLVLLPVRHATHDVRTRLHGGDHEVCGAGVAQDPLLGKRDRAYVRDVRAVAYRGLHPLQRHQAADAVDVYVRAQACRPVQDVLLDDSTGTLPDALLRVRTLRL